MKNNSDISSWVIKVGALIGVALLTAYLFPHQGNTFAYRFEKGKPWAYESLIAEFDFPVYKSEQQYHEECEAVLASYTPYFSMEAGKKDWIMSESDYRRMQAEGFTHISVVNDAHEAKSVAFDQVYTQQSFYEQFGIESGITLTFDSETSNRMRQHLISTVSPTKGYVQAGEKIVDRGEIVTAEIYQILVSFRQAYAERHTTDTQRIVSQYGVFFLVTVLLMVMALFLYFFRHDVWMPKRNILFFAVLLGGVVILSLLTIRFFTDEIWIFVIPMVWIPVIVRVFYDSWTAMLLHLISTLIVALAVPTPLPFVLMQLTAGAAAIITLRNMAQRFQLTMAAVYSFIAYVCTYTLYQLAYTGTLTTTDWRIYLCLLVNAVLVVCSYGVIYVFEKLFRLVSNITLIELTNINTEMMQTFAEKAPGTFQHSLQVGNLASEAAKQIGANALLVRTGALYHDIGKLAHPDFYTENQVGGYNPLLAMTNVEAAQQVIAHVLEGERQARHFGLPEVIIQFIRSHHGTTLVRYFYNSEVNKVGVGNVDETMFRYPGPKPQTKETAILMITDAIEARSRSLSEYTEQSIRAMVEDMVDQQVAQGQFSETPLTFRDLETIKAALIARLITINHHRIAYPTIKQQGEK